MIDKYTKFLKNQISKLDLEDFDLEAWKSATVAALERIYDKTDPKIRQIEQLKIDYSSWALRDSNANYKPVETCKKKGREVLQTAIDELEILGLEPGKNDHINPFDKLPQEIKKQLEGLSAKELANKLKSFKKDTLIESVLALLS